MGFALKFLLATTIAVALAFGALYWTVAGSGGNRSLRNGAWDTDLRLGSAASDMSLRAQIALCCVLALNRKETIYLSAMRDSSGAPFDGLCTYRIEGQDMDARWWSITSYAADNFLIPNEQKRYSVSKTNAQRAPDGSFTARVSKTPLEGNWIPSDPNGFTLTLRLYNPSAALQDNLAVAKLPSIVKEACE